MKEGKKTLNASDHFPAKKLMELSAHIGGRKKDCKPSMREFIREYDPNNNNAVICVKRMQEQLSKAANALYEAAAAGEQILVVGTSSNVSTTVKNCCKLNSIMYVANRWPGGLISNSETTNKNIRKLRASSSVDNMLRTDRLYGGLVLRGSNFQSMESFNPTCILLFSPSTTAIQEVASNPNLRVILVADTTTEVQKIQEANKKNIIVPLNTENIQAGPYIMEQLMSFILTGRNNATQRRLAQRD
jgi:ribosomal protein S2